MSAVATPVRLLGPRDLVRIETCAGEALAAWAARWVAGRSDALPPEAGAWTTALPMQSLRCVGERGGAWVGLAPLDDDAPRLLGSLFGSEALAGEPLGLAAGVVDAAARELSCGLLGALLGRAQPADTAAWRHHTSGGEHAVRFGAGVRIALRAAELRFVVSAAAVGALLARVAVAPVARPAALAPRATAIGEARVGLQAVLAPAEIGLADLVSMRAGDVLMFPHPLASPVFVQTRDGRQVGRAQLGSAAGRRAAQFVDGQGAAGARGLDA